MINLSLVDLQEAAKAVQHASVVLPPTMDALPEETAWQMVYTEGGVLAVLLALGVTVLWRLVSKILAKTQEQNEQLMRTQVEAIARTQEQNEQLMRTQVEAISRLGDAVVKVETAVRMSDLNNTHAITRLSETMTAAVARLDRHEARLEVAATNLLEHSHRIKVLESGAHLVLPPVPGR